MVTASIVVHNTPEKQLEKALECLENSIVSKIYVLDNGSENLLKDTAEKFSKVTYRKIPNKGYGAGHNIALADSAGNNADYHLVMNADILWEGEVISKLVDYMNNNPEVGLVVPKTYYPSGELQDTARMLPTPVDLFVKRFLPTSLSKKRMERYLLKNRDPEKEINCPYLLGSFMFFRNEALKETGLFDERFFMYPEDIDITRRLHENWKTMYWPGVSIIHEHQRSSAKNVRMFLIHTKNMIKYFNKWGWWKDSKRTKFNKKFIDEYYF